MNFPVAPQVEIRVLNSKEQIFRDAANEFSALAQAAVQSKDCFNVALSGGSTPRGLHELLTSGSFPQIPWHRICFFLGDERYVPQDHPDSNFRMAQESLFSKVNAKAVFRVPTEKRDPNIAAREYERAIVEHFHLAPGEFPRFDLILLGLGPDGHTASLFPGTAALKEESHLVVANWVEKFNAYRITFTYPVLNHAANVMFLVSGSDKAAALHSLLEEHADLPAQRVHPTKGRLLWLIDQAAGGSLRLAGAK